MSGRVGAGLRRVAVCVLLASGSTAHAASTCYGTPSRGRLENAERIPASGPNFAPYSRLGVALGRTHVHSQVASVLRESYASLRKTAPGVQYVYGESGWAAGGEIEPHRTHQNGLAVDFMVPVRDEDGESVALPSGVTNKFGYAIDFDAQARHDDLRIDFVAIAEHLHALHAAAKKNGVGLSRVIFDTAYLPRLYATPRGAWIRANIPFMAGKPWIRHDEHYHVDFAVACRPL